MNIELLEEINNKIDEGMNVQEVANTLGLSKSNVLLMLRMQSVFSNHFQVIIDSLKNQNKDLSASILTLNSDKLNLEEENENLKNQIVAPYKSQDDNISLEKYQTLKSDYNYLKMDYDNLKHKLEITRKNLSKFPIWLRQFYKANEVG